MGRAFAITLYVIDVVRVKRLYLIAGGWLLLRVVEMKVINYYELLKYSRV